jgi:hypothetical protein
VKVIYQTALVLIIIGALNWGLIGFFDYNLVDGLFGADSVLSRIVYGLVGISAIYVAIVKFVPQPTPKKAAM